MSRHVYRPPRGKFTGVFAVLGGLLATVAVFVAIPLTQRLTEIFSDSGAAPPELTVEPPEEQSFELDEPPPEEEPEPEPEELVEESSDLDFGMDLGDLTAGTGGGFVMEIPQFGLKGGDDPFGGGDLDAPPSPINRVPPAYPSSLLSKGVGDRVVVSVTINPDGGIAATSVKQSSGHPDLDKAAINAVNRWRFKPGTRAGRNVRAVALVPFNFEVRRN